MSAQSLQVVTLAIPNPEWQGVGSNGNAQRVNASLSFNYVTSFDIRTLSTNGASGGNDVTGLLYVPDLDATDPCVNLSAPYIPQNATRQANLPNTDYDLVAIAPWVGGACSLKFMEAARQDPVRGFLFFVPGNTSATPPDAKDAQWDIGSSSGNWKSQNGFPVYALPGQNGASLMEASAMYSGNMTDVPDGHELTEVYDSRDYVRLFVDIDTGNGTSLPSLWVFLLVVLGILLAIIGITSLTMHLLQRRRRTALQRRVASGEVDLEALGIKRLTVPQELLDKMPLYIYGTGVPVSKVTEEPTTVAEEKLVGTTASPTILSTARPASALLRSTSYRPTPLSQPTCAICLDDFVPASTGSEGTTVRELPCHHIFHPECVDTFLRDSSSLCPMCKKTALPKGYCPKAITNAMVRRERMVRQVRERIVIHADSTESREMDDHSTSVGRFRARTMSGLGIASLRGNRRVSSAPVSTSQQMQQMGITSTPGTADTGTPFERSNSTTSAIPPVRIVQPPSTAGRREWARQRAVDMLGQQAPDDPDAEEARRTPAWRKAVRSMFPGFRR